MTDYPLEVTTARLQLRQWRDDDVPALAAIYADPAVEVQLVPTTLDQTRAQVDRFREAWAAGGPSLWAVDELATGRFIGRIGLNPAPAWELDPAAVEVGWALSREVWGRGYATEGGRASVATGFEVLSLDSIISFTRPTNLASRRVMEKIGLTFRGEADYKSIPHVWYSLGRDQWARSQ